MWFIFCFILDPSLWDLGRFYTCDQIGPFSPIILKFLDLSTVLSTKTFDGQKIFDKYCTIVHHFVGAGEEKMAPRKTTADCFRCDRLRFQWCPWKISPLGFYRLLHGEKLWNTLGKSDLKCAPIWAWKEF